MPAVQLLICREVAFLKKLFYVIIVTVEEHLQHLSVLVFYRQVKRFLIDRNLLLQDRLHNFILAECYHFVQVTVLKRCSAVIDLSAEIFLVFNHYFDV